MAKKILVVEDSRAFRQQIVITLEREGFQTVEAGDGSEGVKKLKSESFDIAVVDVNMPNLNGLDMVSQVKSDNVYQGPIIMLTTEGERDVISKGRDLGIDCWMVKPFDPTALVEAIKKLS